MTERSTRRGLAGAAVAALLAPIALLTGAQAAQAAPGAGERVDVAVEKPATATEVTGGELDWGVRASIRNYLERFGHTNGYVQAYDGAVYAFGSDAATFPVAEGWVDAESDRAEIAFDGRLDLYGFDEHWLDFENVRLLVAEGEATLTVDMRESYNTKHRVDDVVLATFDLAGEAGAGDADLISLDARGDVTLTSGEGFFSETVSEDHLPSPDGENIYGGENGYTDPFALTAHTREQQSDDEGDDDGAGTAEGEQSGGGGGQPGREDDGAEPTPVGENADGPFGESTATNASGAKLTVTPAYALEEEGQTLHLEGSGFPTASPDGKNFGGLYVLFGWIDPEIGDDWAPSKRGVTGKSYDYTDGAGTYQLMVNYPGNTTEPDQPFMDENGDFEMDLPLYGPRFTGAGGRSIDCYKMQCGVMLIGAHGVKNPEGEIFVPAYYTETADETGSETPYDPNGGGPTANPNMVEAAGQAGVGQNGGLGVDGGLVSAADDEGARTVLIGGLLLTSAGLLGAAVMFRRRRIAAAGPGAAGSRGRAANTDTHMRSEG